MLHSTQNFISLFSRSFSSTSRKLAKPLGRSSKLKKGHCKRLAEHQQTALIRTRQLYKARSYQRGLQDRKYEQTILKNLQSSGAINNVNKSSYKLPEVNIDGDRNYAFDYETSANSEVSFIDRLTPKLTSEILSVGNPLRERADLVNRDPVTANDKLGKYSSTDHENKKPPSLSQALYLAKEAGVHTVREEQIHIMKSPSFNSDDSPFLIENFMESATEQGYRDPSGRKFFERLDKAQHSSNPRPIDQTKDNQFERIDQHITDDSILIPDDDSTTRSREYSRSEQLRHSELERWRRRRQTVELVGKSAPAEVNEILAKHFGRLNRKSLVRDCGINSDKVIDNSRSVFWHDGKMWLSRVEGWGTHGKSTAKVVLKRGTGKVYYNGRRSLFTSLFKQHYNRRDITYPLYLTKTAGVYDIFINTDGPKKGTSIHTVAAGLAVSRCLVQSNNWCYHRLEENMCLYEDTRRRQPKRIGRHSAFVFPRWRKRF